MRRTCWRSVFLALASCIPAALLAIACGNSGSPETSMDAGATASFSAVVGPHGGTVGAIRDGTGVSLTVPAGALSKTLTITITPISTPVTGAFAPVYDIGPSGTKFAAPVTLAFPYTAKELGGHPPTDVAVSTVVAGAWQATSAPIVNAGAGTIAGLLTHLSPYTLAPVQTCPSPGPAPATGLYDFYSYRFVPDGPNGFDMYGEIIFYGLGCNLGQICTPVEHYPPVDSIGATGNGGSIDDSIGGGCIGPPACGATYGIAGISVGSTSKNAPFQYTGGDLLSLSLTNTSWNRSAITAIELQFASPPGTIGVTVEQDPGAPDGTITGPPSVGTQYAAPTAAGRWQFKTHWQAIWPAGPQLPPGSPPLPTPTGAEFADPLSTLANTCCTSPQTLCSIGCTDTQTDSTNCGTCGDACPNGEVCSNGACSSSGGGLGSDSGPCGTSGMPGMSTVSVGYGTACAVIEGGDVACWGSNQYGELGDGACSGGGTGGCAASTNSTLPVQVTGLASGVTAVSAGTGAACAVTAGGGVECWGQEGQVGLLGNGATSGVPVPTPVQVTGLTSGVTSVSVGVASACALTAGGGVVCWGGNPAGELGNGTTTNSGVPVQVTGLTSGVTSVSAGNQGSACAVVKSGGVVCWGDNSEGELGNGSTKSSSVPAQVTGLTSGATSVSVGFGSACAVTAGGGVMCWGDNSEGELGNRSTVSSTTPVQVVGLTSGVTSVAVGGTGNRTSACAVTANGGVVCWGYNATGQLGNGTKTSSSVPVPITGLGGSATSVSVGTDEACAVTACAVDCWGESSLGNALVSSSTVPVPVNLATPIPLTGSGSSPGPSSGGDSGSRPPPPLGDASVTACAPTGASCSSLLELGVLPCCNGCNTAVGSCK